MGEGGGGHCEILLTYVGTATTLFIRLPLAMPPIMQLFRKHWQKTFVTLSGFWPLLGWRGLGGGGGGGLVNTLKKENL